MIVQLDEAIADLCLVSGRRAAIVAAGGHPIDFERDEGLIAFVEQFGKIAAKADVSLPIQRLDAVAAAFGGDPQMPAGLMVVNAGDLSAVYRRMRGSRDDCASVVLHRASWHPPGGGIKGLSAIRRSGALPPTEIRFYALGA
jgi:hypothetical protein